MSVASSVKPSLVELPGLPKGVEVAEPFVDLDVVEGDVGDDLLFEGGGVGVVVDAVFESEGLELFVSVEAVLHGLGDLVSEVLDQVFEGDQVGDGPFGSLGEDVADEDDKFVGGVIIDARDDRCGVNKFVLLEQSVEALLESFFVCDSLRSYEKDSDDENFHICRLIIRRIF